MPACPVRRVVAALCLLGVAAAALAQEKEPPVLPGVKATAERAPEPEPSPPPPPAFDPQTTSGRVAPVENTLGSPLSASQGQITPADLTTAPIFRPDEIFDLIPGVVTNMESGGGYASTFYLRGFNLDHGTDFALSIDDVQWNLPTQVDGQGFLDTHPLIPELIGRFEFRKGPYYAQVGDFSSVGSASIHYVDRLPQGIFKVEAGQYGWLRGLVANSGNFAGGTLLYAVEARHSDSSYDRKNDFNIINGIFKYTRGDELDYLTVSALAYNASWFGNTILPLRAVEEGLVGLRGNLDNSDGGFTSRYTLNSQWFHKDEDFGFTARANVYVVYFQWTLFANHTFFLDDPDHGDQINMLDRRWREGANFSNEWDSWLLGQEGKHTIGVQLINDSIGHVGLHHTEDRLEINPVTDAVVDEFTGGIYYINDTKWAPKLRTVFGVRGDYFHANANDQDVPINSGKQQTSVISPKGSLILGPFNKTELFLNGGYSFHSNDVRDVTAQLQPSSLAPGAPLETTQPVPLVARTRGAEVGFRSQDIPNLTSSAALWYLRLQSELVFAGDTGTTEPRPASERYGVEFSNTYQVNSWLTLNADFTASHARFLEDTGSDPNIGRHVPEAVGTLFRAGPIVQLPYGLFANLRYSYFGPRYLIEDGSQSSRATNLVELRMGYYRPNFTVGMQIYNLFNANGHDTDFFFPSALRTDPGFGTPGFAGVPDIHFKALEAFTTRFYLTYRW
jgi:hypothetical protein